MDAGLGSAHHGQRPGRPAPRYLPGIGTPSSSGGGASSHVYRAFDPESLEPLGGGKVLPTDDPEDPARKRFKREGEITANLGKHPHIVQVLGTGFTSSGSPFVVMEYFEQGSVADRLRREGTYPVGQALDIGEKIADAVAAAHRAGIVQRDIKPQNILVSQYGPALGDFGIARATANLEWSQSLDQLTPMHAAPEVLLNEPPSERSDVYSLGSTLCTMLAGRPPFAGLPGEPPLRYQVRVVQEPVAPIARPDIPPEVTEALERALAKGPEDRFASADELRDCLRTLRLAADQRARPDPAATPASIAAARTSTPVTDLLDPPGGGLTNEPDGATIVGGRQRVEMPAASPSAGIHRPPALADNQKPAIRARDGEGTIHRDRQALTGLQEESLPGRRARKRRVLAVAGGIVGLVAVAVVVAVLVSPSPPVVPVRHQYTVPTVDTAKATLGPPVDHGNSITLHWTAPVAHIAGYHLVTLKAAAGSGRTSTAATDLPATATSFTSTRLDPQTLYCFELRAIVVQSSGRPALGAPAQVCPRGGSIG